MSVRDSSAGVQVPINQGLQQVWWGLALSGSGETVIAARSGIAWTYPGLDRAVSLVISGRLMQASPDATNTCFKVRQQP